LHYELASVTRVASTLQLANSEIFPVVSDSVVRMFGRGTAKTILPEEALPCYPCLRIMERLVRMKAGG